ncbi:MAG: sensor histidine kinase [Phycisphaerae bacterium]
MPPVTERAESRTGDTREAQLEAEVEALRRELARARRLATMGTMTAMVAHEFRNILTPMVNSAQLARRSPELAAKAMDRVTNGSRRASSICSALLGLTRESQESEQVRVAELVNEALDAMARPPQRDSIELLLDVPEQLTITTRRVELEHVLLNLLINARKALLRRPAGRRLEISACTDGRDVLLQVGDNGPGIAAEHMERIFEPFYTLGNDENNENSESGHGLGLAVCRELVQSLGGDISVSSEVNEGTTFTIRLPG